MIKLKKNDILKDLSNDIFSSEEEDTNLEQSIGSDVDNQIFSVETPNDIFVDMSKTEDIIKDNLTIDSQLDEIEKPIDMSLQQEIVSEVKTEDINSNTNEEINFDKINEMLEEAIQKSDKQDEVSLNDINNAIEKEEDNVSLNDINTILENHFNDVKNASELSFNELEEKTVDINFNEEETIDEALMDYKDEDITFNDLNNMTQEFNLEELNAVLEQIEEQLDEEIVEEEVVEEKKDTTIESTFPKLDKFGSVFPRKSM